MQTIDDDDHVVLKTESFFTAFSRMEYINMCIPYIAYMKFVGEYWHVIVSEDNYSKYCTEVNLY